MEPQRCEARPEERIVTSTQLTSETSGLASGCGQPSLCAAFQASAARHPERVALRTVGGEVHMTWARYAEEVERVAGGLATLGARHGDRVMFLATNTPQLAIAETAALHL